MTHANSESAPRPAPRRLSLPDRYYERALDHFAKSRLELALADLDEAIRHNPRKAEYYAARGLVLLLSEWQADAEADFAQALRLDPAQWLAYYGRGMLAFQEGKFTEAVDQFSRAQRLAPQRPEVYVYRAAAFYRAGNPHEALADLQVALPLFAPRDARRQTAERWLELVGKAAR
ncbi:MAG: hypothetical protein KatS3mg051_0238 [Anaerolineae bacterium]|nr:MAG: hypothetical protein KatS3mg051_0238 [Anaerolineae bacterium]